MTNAFDWKNKPSEMGAVLEKEAKHRRSSSSVVNRMRGEGKDNSTIPHLSTKQQHHVLDPRRFHVYSLAKVPAK